jgi:predicted MFS family arabinose efflux permease
MDTGGNDAASRHASIALAACVALAVAMGIGRFAFTPVLPLMQDEYAMPVSDAGWLAASNYIGYFLGSLAYPLIRVRPQTTIRSGLVAIAALTAAMAAVDGFVPWLVLRGLAGFASAVVFIAVSAWALQALASAARPLLNASVYAGVGTGIAGAGLICVAAVRLSFGADDAWLILGAASLVLAASVWRSFPVEAAAQSQAQSRGRVAWNAERVRLIVAYGFFGFGYIVPATFLPAMAKQSLAEPQSFVWAWPIFGAAAAISTYALAFLPKGVDLRRAWLYAQVAMAIGVALPVASKAHAATMVSALAVGGTFMVITAAAIQEARRSAPEQTNAFIAAMTASFALGQIAGPVAVSLLAGTGDVYAAPLACASALLVVGAVLLAARSHRMTAKEIA